MSATPLWDPGQYMCCGGWETNTELQKPCRSLWEESSVYVTFFLVLLLLRSDPQSQLASCWYPHCSWLHRLRYRVWCQIRWLFSIWYICVVVLSDLHLSVSESSTLWHFQWMWWPNFSLISPHVHHKFCPFYMCILYMTKSVCLCLFCVICTYTCLHR